MGPPGSGKGTQAELLAEKLTVKKLKISTRGLRYGVLVQGGLSVAK